MREVYYSPMEKFDLKKSLPDYFKAPKSEFAIVKFPKFNYLMVDGKGDPNTSSRYTEAIELLYGASYTLKFQVKNELEMDYVVPPLEGLWSADDMDTFKTREKSKWIWTMMIMVPNGITKTQVTKAIKSFKEKKRHADVSKLRFDSLFEGFCLQTLHIGPYEAEGPVLARMHDEFMPKNNFQFNGTHHEIYLSDPRKTPTEKLKTILRQPVKKL